MKYGALRIYKSNELPDFQKSGYFNNLTLGNPIASDGTLLPFFYGFVTTGSGITITSFSLESLDRSGNLCTTYALTSTWVELENNNEHKIFKYRGNQDILGSLSSYSNGIYRYKVVVSTGKIYYSAPFLISDYKIIPTIGIGDFDLTDFDTIDFY